MSMTAREVEMSHTIDDIETARTKLVRDRAEVRRLLTDALHALRNGAPHVTDEFIDRALTFCD